MEWLNVNIFIKLLTTVSLSFIYVFIYTSISCISSKYDISSGYSKKDIIFNTIKKYKEILYTDTIAIFIILGYTILLIIPGIIKMLQLLYINIVIVLENKTGLDALKVSKSIFKTNKLNITFIYLSLTILLLFLNYYISKLISNSYLKIITTNLVSFIVGISIFIFLGFHIVFQKNH